MVTKELKKEGYKTSKIGNLVHETRVKENKEGCQVIAVGGGGGGRGRGEGWGGGGLGTDSEK